MLLKIKQVAQELSMSIKSVRKLIRDGKLHAVKIGKLWRVDEADLQAFIMARRT